MVALARRNSEAAIRRAIDDLFELAFEADPNAMNTSTYHVESKVHVVKYDDRAVHRGPSSVATADGAVVIRLPQKLLLKLLDGGLVYAGPDMDEEYTLSFVEYKGGLNNNGRRAIMDSAAMSAVNRALGVTNIKNYSFSIHHAWVDVIISWWVPQNIGYQYRFKRKNNRFQLTTPIDWFLLYSFLCRLRHHHRSVRDTLEAASPPSILQTRDLFHLPNLPSTEGRPGDNNEESGGADNTEGGEEMRDTEHGIALGDEASTFWEVPADKFCQGDDDSEEEEDDGYETDKAAPRDVGAKVKSWQDTIAAGPLPSLPLHQPI
ncbi:hypothetical protein DFH07DRAFT_301552 [Mycena maculata]|uniref:Uncharacterized protein n=1 Tax=Mycena maculata TaxID=230809 RepID=A0AAD7JNP9_9AGAR|nr:hypothetical protein DFH07DRAFT_301552 [Mycena maculata]